MHYRGEGNYWLICNVRKTIVREEKFMEKFLKLVGVVAPKNDRPGKTY